MASRKHDSKLWKQYYDVHRKNRRPSAVLREAIRYNRAVTVKSAIDLGCGTGNDTTFLLKRGYAVFSLDGQKTAIAILRKKVPKKFHSKLLTRVVRFETLRRRDLAPISILNASYSIFFCRRSSFGRLWRNLTGRIHPGGIFCGQFLGVRDSWSKRRGLTAHSKRELRKLFSDFDIIKLSEREDNSGTATGRPKHWHVYTVIARKKDGGAR